MSLQGKTILVTRPREQAGQMIAEIERRGGRAVLFPTISITEPDSWQACDDAIARLGSYHALVFTSVNGVKGFRQRCLIHGTRLADFTGLLVYAVGQKTKDELVGSGFRVDFLPSEYSASALATGLSRLELNGRRILFPRGNIGREEIVDALAGVHAIVDPVTVYKTIPASVDEADLIAREISSGRINVVTFASPSAAANFFAAVPRQILASMDPPVCLAAIGPTTESSLREMGCPVDIVANESTSDGLVEAIDSYFN